LLAYCHGFGYGVNPMGRSKIYTSPEDRRRAQNLRRKVARTTQSVGLRIPQHFTGVDGEGIGHWRDHKYVLLGIGNRQIEDSQGLQLKDIFTFLWSTYETEAASVYAGYYLGYDFTQWLKLLPKDRAWYLFTQAGINKRRRTKSGVNPIPFPVRWQEWEFDILGMKRFKLRPIGEHSWLYVCDAGPFFQTSFLKAIDPSKWTEPVITETEYEMLKTGKERRSTAVLDNDMRTYNALENDILGRLLVRLSQGFDAMGIRLNRDQWFGPGQVAQEWLKTQETVPSAAELSKITITLTASPQSGDSCKTLLPSIAALNLGRMAYYGGWFEIFCHGHIPGRTWEYDINNAYTHIARELPCLRHGEWTYATGRSDTPLRGGAIRIAHATVKGTDRHIGAMLHRHPDGRITRPWNTRGYYWQHELDAAIKAGLVDSADYLETWTYVPCNCPNPLARLAVLYDYRLSIGKDTPHGKAAKLAYISVYGKFAQSVGNPKYGNAIYASLITAGCRAMILESIALAGTGHVTMVATDAIFTTKQIDLPLSDKLGEWSVKEHENLCQFKPGIYWDDTTRRSIANGDLPVFKSRGIDAKTFSQQITEIDSQFSRWPKRYPGERDPDGPRQGWFPRISFRSDFSMVTCQQALQRGKWFLAGAVSGQRLTQDADPVAKRHEGWYDPDSGIYWSQPHKGWWETESTPYDKTFGQGDTQNPEDYGIHPDGWVLDLWKEGLHG
jgi:hypothetical protein